MSAELTGLLQSIKGTLELGRDKVVKETLRTKLNRDRGLLLQRLGSAALELMDAGKLPDYAELKLPRARLREVDDKLEALNRE